MRINIRHVTRYTYDEPARSVVQLLRLTPRSHDGQHVAQWRIDIDVDGRLRQGEDGFGNIVHRLYVERAITGIAITVTGTVDTTDTHGVVRGQAEPLPERIFLRETPLTRADPAIRAFADGVRVDNDPLATTHALLAGIYERISFDTSTTDVATSAGDAFALGSGVCQDLAHIFIAGARHLGLPARYVSGQLVRSDTESQEASHAWVETLIPDLGWVAFDPTNGVSASDAYVRVAVGLDYLDASPVRGSRYGGGGERMDVELTIADSSRRLQSQSQS